MRTVTILLVCTHSLSDSGHESWKWLFKMLIFRCVWLRLSYFTTFAKPAYSSQMILILSVDWCLIWTPEFEKQLDASLSPTFKMHTSQSPMRWERRSPNCWLTTTKTTMSLLSTHGSSLNASPSCFRPTMNNKLNSNQSHCLATHCWVRL